MVIAAEVEATWMNWGNPSRDRDSSSLPARCRTPRRSHHSKAPAHQLVLPCVAAIGREVMGESTAPNDDRGRRTRATGSPGQPARHSARFNDLTTAGNRGDP